MKEGGCGNGRGRQGRGRGTGKVLSAAELRFATNPSFVGYGEIEERREERSERCIIFCLRCISIGAWIPEPLSGTAATRWKIICATRLRTREYFFLPLFFLFSLPFLPSHHLRPPISFIPLKVSPVFFFLLFFFSVILHRTFVHSLSSTRIRTIFFEKFKFLICSYVWGYVCSSGDLERSLESNNFWSFSRNFVEESSCGE